MTATPEHYVRDSARERGLTEVLVTAHELLRAATGNPIVVGTLDGQEVLLRLPTPEEMIEMQRRAIDSMPGIPGPPLMSRADAERLAAPLNLPR